MAHANGSLINLTTFPRQLLSRDAIACDPLSIVSSSAPSLFFFVTFTRIYGVISCIVGGISSGSFGSFFSPNFASLVPIWIARQMASRVVSSGPSLLSSLLASNQSRNWSRTLRYFIGNQVSLSFLFVAAPVVCWRRSLRRPSAEKENRQKLEFRRVTIYIFYFFRRELCWRCWTTAIKDRPSQAKKGREGCGWVCVFSKRRENKRERERARSICFVFSALWLVEINGGGTLAYVCTVFLKLAGPSFYGFSSCLTGATRPSWFQWTTALRPEQIPAELSISWWLLLVFYSVPDFKVFVCLFPIPVPYWCAFCS